MLPPVTGAATGTRTIEPAQGAREYADAELPSAALYPALGNRCRRTLSEVDCVAEASPGLHSAISAIQNHGGAGIVAWAFHRFPLLPLHPS